MIAAPFQKQNNRVIFPDIFSFSKLDQVGGFVANLMDNGILQLSQLQWNQKKLQITIFSSHSVKNHSYKPQLFCKEHFRLLVFDGRKEVG